MAAVVAPQVGRAVPHIHALLAGAIDPMPCMQVWTQTNGWARITSIYDADGAVGYVARHIVRGGDVLFSDGLSLQAPVQVEASATLVALDNAGERR